MFSISFLVGTLTDFSAVFHVSGELLYDFIHSIVKDWKFQHWSRWMTNELFMNGVHTGDQNEGSYGQIPQVGHFGNFIGSLKDFLYSIESGEPRRDTTAVPLNATSTAQIMQLEGERSSLPVLQFIRSNVPRKGTIIKSEPESRDACLLSQSFNESPKIDSETPVHMSRTHEWKTVQSCGAMVSLYEPRESKQ